MPNIKASASPPRHHPSVSNTAKIALLIISSAAIAAALNLRYDGMALITLPERGRCIWCTAHTLQLWALGTSRRLLTAEALAAADGLPLGLWVSGVPVVVGVDGVTLTCAAKIRQHDLCSIGNLTLCSKRSRDGRDKDRQTTAGGRRGEIKPLTYYRRNYCDADSAGSGLD